jgi:hypothetical protein
MAQATTQDPIRNRVRQGLGTRLLALQRSTQWVHLVALGAVFILLWGRTPDQELLPWAGGIALVGLARVMATQRALRRTPPLDRLRRTFRWALLLTALVWSLGAVVLTTRLQPEDRILILAVFTTFLAGAVTSLSPDPVTFAGYAVTLMVPALGAQFLAARDRPSLVAAAMGTGFTVFAIAMNRRANRSLVNHLETSARLEEALRNVQTLSGLLPICSSCKKIRDDRGYWTHVESYIRDHTEADFSHGLCPECARKFFPDLMVTGDN